MCGVKKKLLMENEFDPDALAPLRLIAIRPSSAEPLATPFRSRNPSGFRGGIVSGSPRGRGFRGGLTITLITYNEHSVISRCPFHLVYLRVYFLLEHTHTHIRTTSKNILMQNISKRISYKHFQIFLYLTSGPKTCIYTFDKKIHSLSETNCPELTIRFR